MEEKSKYTKTINWKQFYRNVFALVIPIAIQNLINVGVTATDVIMLGKVGEKVLSGASLAGQIQYIMTLIFYGVTSGATVLTAQYWGKKDTRTIEKVLGMGLSAGLIVAVVFAGAALGMPETLMRIYTSDPEVIAEGVKYLRIVGFSYVFMAVTQVYLNIMRSIERVMVATFIYLISLLMNIVVNAVLIFGLFGFPVMGVRGAAIGTLCARAAETVMVLVYAIFRNKVVRIRLKDMVKIDKVLLKDFAVYSMPVVLNELMWGLGTSANTAVIGHLGSAAVAANSVAQACNSRNIRDFPCNGDLSRQDDRGRQDGTGKGIRKTFCVVKSDSWNPGWCADTDLGTNRQCESGTDRTGKELLKFHVLRYVVFYCGTGI